MKIKIFGIPIIECSSDKEERYFSGVEGYSMSKQSYGFLKDDYAKDGSTCHHSIPACGGCKKMFGKGGL